MTYGWQKVVCFLVVETSFCVYDIRTSILNTSRAAQTLFAKTSQSEERHLKSRGRRATMHGFRQWMY